MAAAEYCATRRNVLYRDSAWQVVRRMHTAADLSLNGVLSCHCMQILPNTLGFTFFSSLGVGKGITQPQCMSVGMCMRLPTMWVPGTWTRFASVLSSSLTGRVTS